MMMTMTEEKRVQRRERVLKSAKIVFNNKGSVLDCTVTDRSPLGARVKFPDMIATPDYFEITLDGQRREARKIWAAGRAIGIAFN